MKLIKLHHAILAIAIIFISACASNGGAVSTGPVTEVQKKAAIDFVTKMVSAQAPPGMAPNIEFEEELPSDLPGFNLLKLKIAVGPSTQSISLYFSADGKKAIPAQAVIDTEAGMPAHGGSPQQQASTQLEPGTLNLEGQPSKGPEDAKVSVVVISDFQCPACRHFNQIFDEHIWPSAEGQIKVTFINYPLVRIHPWAMPAAMLSECALKQNVKLFWKMHDGFFENQSDIVAANVLDKGLSYISGEQFDEAALRSCYDNKETEEDVKADMAQGDKIGLKGTPTYIVNNKVLTSGLTPDAIQQALSE